MGNQYFRTIPLTNSIHFKAPLGHLPPRMKLAACMLLMGACLSCTRIVVSRNAGNISLYPYEPRSILSEADLPDDIREKMYRHLESRIGAKYFALLKVEGGQTVDKKELDKVNPASRNYQWQVFKFNVCCEIEDQERGFRYISSIWLDEQGNVLREFEFPDIGQSPEKEKIISYSEAKKIAKQIHYQPAGADVAFRYDSRDDSLYWIFKRWLGGNEFHWKEHLLIINAHTGKVVTNTKTEHYF